MHVVEGLKCNVCVLIVFVSTLKVKRFIKLNSYAKS